jgi:hypothetical protein
MDIDHRYFPFSDQPSMGKQYPDNDSFIQNRMNGITFVAADKSTPADAGVDSSHRTFRIYMTSEFRGLVGII